MILLDTNVISEPLRARADPTVMRWFDRQPPGTLLICSITVGELLFGTARLPEGRRRMELLASVERILRRFHGTVLPYDEAAARV